MVNYNERPDRTFAALVDPTRRAILARLEREDGASIGALAQPFVIKLPAVMKHLNVLDQDIRRRAERRDSMWSLEPSLRRASAYATKIAKEQIA